MKHVYIHARKLFRALSIVGILALSQNANAQKPTSLGQGSCGFVTANFNNNDNGFNSSSIYGGMFDSTFYYNENRGYWTEYMPPLRTTAPAAPRVVSIISPPYQNPSQVGTFNVGFYYIVPNPTVNRFQVRIISVTETPSGTVTNIEASSGPQFFSRWSTPTPYTDPEVPQHFGNYEGYVCLQIIDQDITNAPNTTYRVEVAYVMEPGATNEKFTVFDNLSIGSQENVPLPVNFIGIVANRNNNAVNVKWDVSEEINVKEYQVERSSTGGSFTTVGTVDAKGKSIYNFTDASAGTGTIYYRVKSVDIDGRSKYSGIIKLRGNNNSYASKLNVYPMPAQSTATLEHKKLEAGATITISTLDGKVLKMIRPAAGASHTPVDLSTMTPGMYLVRLDDGTGVNETVKLIKQ